MPIRRYKPERIVTVLRQIEAPGEPSGNRACKKPQECISARLAASAPSAFVEPSAVGLEPGTGLS